MFNLLISLWLYHTYNLVLLQVCDSTVIVTTIVIISIYS